MACHISTKFEGVCDQVDSDRLDAAPAEAVDRDFMSADGGTAALLGKPLFSFIVVVDARVVRLVGEGVGSGDSKSLGWFRVATILILSRE